MRIAILKAEEGFPSAGLPGGLTPEWIRKVLTEGGEEAVFVAPGELNNLEVTDSSLLILPYGEAFPEESIAGLLRYYNFGGRLITTAGRGIWEILRLRSDGSRERSNINAYEKVLANLGLKWYEVPVSPFAVSLDRKLLKGLPDNIDESPGPFGIVPNTSDGRPYARPWAGNAFPDRIPVRDWYVLAKSLDRFGKYKRLFLSFPDLILRSSRRTESSSGLSGQAG